MIDWAARAREHFEQTRGGVTVETDETKVASVSTVPDLALTPQKHAFSSVSSVGGPEPNKHLGGDNSATDASQRSSGNPYMSPEQGDECHAEGWDDSEIESFMARTQQFSAIGRQDAEHLAERLTLRDRDDDDRRLCLECTWLGAAGRCLAAANGRIPNANPWLEPEQALLRWCPAFGLRKGLR